MEQERKKMEEQQKKDDMTFRLVHEFPDAIEYQYAYKLLGDKNWDYQKVADELRK